MIRLLYLRLYEYVVPGGTLSCVYMFECILVREQTGLHSVGALSVPQAMLLYKQPKTRLVDSFLLFVLLLV